MGCQGSKDSASQPAAVATGGVAAERMPRVAQKAPYKTALVEGQTYYWCSCGLSKNQPFCDGSHKGTEYVPKAFTYDKPSGDGYLCGCKNNQKEAGPFCDGSHTKIDW